MTNRYTHNGMTLTIAEWSDLTGINRLLIKERLYRGYPIAVAISNEYGRKTPPQRAASRQPVLSREASSTLGTSTRTYTHDGMTKTLAEWADYAGITYDALKMRMHRGRTLAEALAMPIGTYRGVASDFAPSKGTGAGGTLQETPNITFPHEASE